MTGLDGEPTTYTRAGSAAAPAVVFLHGIGSNAGAFDGVLDRLPTVYQGIAPNAPGYGGSAPLTADRPAVGDYADALLAFLDRLGLPQVHLVGSSLGALIAAAVAAGHPDRVASLLLTAPVTGYGGSPRARRAELAARAELIALGPEQMARTRAPLLIASAAAEPLRAVREATLALDPAAYMQAAHALAGGDLLADAPRIRARTMVVCGTADGVAPPEDHARPIAAALPAAELVLLPGLGHVIELEAPGRLATLIARHAAGAG